MRNAKKLFITMIIASGLMIPAAALAENDFDLGIYGGYTFANRLEMSGGTSESDGGNLGALGHVIWDFPVLDLGIGGGYSQAWLSDGSFDYVRRTVFLDGMIRLDLPAIPLIPYVRAGVPVWDNLDGDRNCTDWFHSVHLGAGLDVSLPLPLVHVFGEYLFSAGRQGGDNMRGHAVNAGIRLVI